MEWVTSHRDSGSAHTADTRAPAASELTEPLGLREEVDQMAATPTPRLPKLLVMHWP